MSDQPAIGAVPPWCESLGVAAWISAADGRLTHLNRGAERLLGRSDGAWAGRPCHEVIAGSDPSGRPICGPDCRLRRDCGAGGALRPLRMCILDHHRVEHWVRVLPIALDATGADGRILHCALDDTRTRRMEEYLEHLAARPHRHGNGPGGSLHLTRREREILRRLDEAQTLHEISFRLGVSYATVRNHVQHILSKLEAHSIQEVVALDLLGRLR